jgi:multidrug resistance efflux pump
MGWARTLFLGDIGNRLDIADTERDIASIRRQIAAASHGDDTQNRRIQTLSRENAELKLYLAALTRLLLQKGAIERQELETLVDAIDAEDGQRDGGYQGEVL